MENQESFNHILVSISTESCAKDETQNDSPTAANILKNYIAANSDIDNFTIYKDNLYVLINSNDKNEINNENTIIKMRTRNNRALYESIMRKVSRVVKQALNENDNEKYHLIIFNAETDNAFDGKFSNDLEELKDTADRWYKELTGTGNDVYCCIFRNGEDIYPWKCLYAIGVDNDEL